MMDTVYEPIAWASQEKILAAVFDRETDISLRRRLIFSAAYFQDKEFFIKFALRGFRELEPELKNKLMDAVHGYIEARDTVFGISELVLPMQQFVADCNQEEYPGNDQVLEDVLYYLERKRSKA